MQTTEVREGESLGMLSARLARPGCMLLRANGLFSEAWLLPGRQIRVPDADYCAHADAPCPVQALMTPAMAARPGRALTLNAAESLQELAQRLGQATQSLRLLLPPPDTLPAGAEVFVPSE